MALYSLSDGWMGVREDVTMPFLVAEGRFSITNHVRPTLAYYIQSQMTATPAAWRRITMLFAIVYSNHSCFKPERVGCGSNWALNNKIIRSGQTEMIVMQTS